MTIPEYYEYLTKKPFISKGCQFIFDKPDDSNLKHFHIWENGHGVFGSDYVITESREVIIVRIKAFGHKTRFVVRDSSGKEINNSIFPRYLELPIEDFLSVLSGGQWAVEAVTPDA